MAFRKIELSLVFFALFILVVAGCMPFTPVSMEEVPFRERAQTQEKGDVRVTDSSGKISIQYVDGNVNLTDESGAIDINDISGNVLIRRTGSGELNIERVKGQVTAPF